MDAKGARRGYNDVAVSGTLAWLLPGTDPALDSEPEPGA